MSRGKGDFAGVIKMGRLGGSSLAVQGLGLLTFTAVALGELRSRNVRGEAKKKKKRWGNGEMMLD